jgi:chorismate mutase/ribosomal protein S18 acetylase RimI-like enzyme
VTPTEASATHEISLRPALESDLVDLARIHVAAREAAPMPNSIHAPAAVRGWLAGRMGGDEFWVAEAGSRIVGYARFGPGWLDDLYVDPAHARRGIGTALLGLVQARLQEGFCLWVFEENVPAREFYARHGCVELEWTDGASNEERAPDIRVAWPGREPLPYLRALIDDVDVQLGDLLARRAALTAAVQTVKSAQQETETPHREVGREDEIVDRVSGRAPALGRARVARIMDSIIAESIAAARSSDRG